MIKISEEVQSHPRGGAHLPPKSGLVCNGSVSSSSGILILYFVRNDCSVAKPARHFGHAMLIFLYL